MSKALIIIGESDDERILSLAKREAEKNGDYIVTTWKDFMKTPFTTAALLAKKPATIIILGTPPKKRTRSIFLKCLISEEYVTIREKYKDPEVLKTPRLILILGPAPKMCWSLAEARRFSILSET